MSAEAEQFKLKGNDLFADGKTDEAIEMYSKAIELEKSHIYYSNRSAAYLKKGEPQKALDDANMCLELNPDFEKGYHRKGAALQGLKKFDEAVAVYDDGISKFPESEELKKKLEKSKLAKESASELAQSVRSSKASMLASKSKQQKAADSQDLSAFVQNTKIALELQIIALKAQLDLVKALGSMSDDAKMKLLFQLVDVDQDGKIDARELADAIRKRNAYLSLSQSLERAISFVAAFDENNDAHLDFSEFTQFLNTFADSMGVSFHEISEFLILQNLFSESGNTFEEDLAGLIAKEAIDEAVKDQEEIYNAMYDQRMVSLFGLFDKDGTGDISFREAAVGLWQLTDDMEDSAKTAVSVLLMMTEEDERTLDYEAFARLILSVCGASGLTFDEAADDMTLAMLQNKKITEDDLLNLMIGEAVYSEAKGMIEEEKEAAEIMDALQYGRLQKLFDLWDTDNNGSISFEELINGMRKFQGQMAIEESVQNAALVMIGFDEDQSQSLDRVEFAKAMFKYAKAAEVSLGELVDFMTVVSCMEENSPQEKAFFKAISPQATAEIKEIEESLEALGLE